MMANVGEPTPFGWEQIRVVIDAPSGRQQRFDDRANFRPGVQRYDAMFRQ
jgi:hypothetical protein